MWLHYSLQLVGEKGARAATDTLLCLFYRCGVYGTGNTKLIEEKEVFAALYSSRLALDAF